MKPLYIFDLDGTLALTEHRQHILDNKDDPQRWQRFFAACVNDQPNDAVIRTMEVLRRSFADVQIWSGRSDEVRAETTQWLARHTSFMTFQLDALLRMRRAGDYTPDEELKRQWLDELRPTDRRRLTAVFDDRDKVVAMWRAAGVPCFQVAPGAF